MSVRVKGRAVLWMIDSGLTVLLTLTVIVIPYIYVSSERTFYHWDLAHFQNLTSTVARMLHQSRFWWLREVIQSLGDTYNKMFTLPLVPFVLAFGDSRLVYVTSVAVVYMLPLALVVGAVATTLIPCHRRGVFWSASILALFTPIAWAPILRGWPDVGAVVLISIAVWLYLQDVTLKTWWRGLFISFFIAAAMIFRRHFVYGATAFFIAIFLQALLAFASEVKGHSQEALRDLFKLWGRVCLLGAATLIILALLAWDFLLYVVNHDNRVHDSYVRSIFENVQRYAWEYGWATWVLAVLGLVGGIKTRLLENSAATFVVLFGGTSLLQWIVYVRQLGTQYALHFLLVIVLGLTAFVWVAWIRYRGVARAVLLSTVLVFLVVNFVQGLTFTQILGKSPIRPLLSADYPPKVRSDYDEVMRLVKFLRTAPSHREPIYVVASSSAINWDVLKNAEKVLVGKGQSLLNLPYTPNVDSRDYYPQALELLLQAQHVVVATPFQHHLPAAEQKVMKIVYLAFMDYWEIARDFVRLPEQFFLANEIRVNIYKRQRESSPQVALRTLEAMQHSVGLSTRANQPDWINLSYGVQSSIAANRDQSHRIRIAQMPATGSREVSFLYIGEIPEHAKLSGVMSSDNHGCTAARLRVSVINSRYKTIPAAEVARQPADQEFDLSFEKGDGVYLLLNVRRDEDNSTDCHLRINQLAISQGQS